MNDSWDKNKQSDNTIGRLSAALFVTQDDSLASLLLTRGINVRDFIFLSFLADRGPMSNMQLANVVDMKPEKVQQSLERLSSAGLVQHKPDSVKPERETVAALTGHGQAIARRINNQS